MSGWLGRWGPAAAGMAVLFALSSVPNAGPLPADLSDKVAHLVAYAGLAVLLMRGTSGGTWAGCTSAAALAAWAIASLYGVTDEWHQSFVPGRSPSGLDLVADTAGAALGAFAVWILARIRMARGRAV